MKQIKVWDSITPQELEPIVSSYHLLESFKKYKKKWKKNEDGN